MLRQCVSLYCYASRFAARILELNPFVPYMTRDIWARVSAWHTHAHRCTQLSCVVFGVRATCYEAVLGYVNNANCIYAFRPALI